MSSILLPLLLLLMLSLHASDARLLRNDTSKQVDQPSSTIKENEVLDRVWNEGERKPNYSSLPNNNGIAKENHENEVQRAVVDEAKGVKVLSERVSWKVPHHHNKGGGGQPQPGFNLDYLPPKTHPPVHN